MRILVLLFALLLAFPAMAQQDRRGLPLQSGLSAGARYLDCLAHAARAPADAFEEALAWASGGGAEPAQHCAAVALFHNGQLEAAAYRLQQLAIDMRLFAPELRAEVLAQAGRAWLDARNPARAAAAFSTALELAPAQIELWIDRAEAHAAAADYRAAIDDLNHAATLDAGRADIFAFRAAAYRLVGLLDLAFEDAERAVRMDPNLPEGWLERAILQRQRGDTAAARRDFLQVLLLDPDGPAGEAARANIERMELKLEEPATPSPPVSSRHRR